MNTVNENKSFLFFPTDTCLFTLRWCSSFPFPLWEAGKLCLLAIPAISMPIWREQAVHCHFCSFKYPARTSFFPRVLKLGNSWFLGRSLWALRKLHRGSVIKEWDINVNSSMWALWFSEKTSWDTRSWTDPNSQVNNHSAVLFPWLLWVSFFTHLSHLWSLVYSWCWVWQNCLSYPSWITESEDCTSSPLQ